MSDKVSRRQFAKIAGLSAAGMAGPLELADAKPAAAPRGESGFPVGFVWGTATSSYQVEGAVNEDGRGASIWDRFVRIPGKIEDGTTGDRANEHYHREKEDIALIRDLSCKAYRFSVAWPRAPMQACARRSRTAGSRSSPKVLPLDPRAPWLL
ncbi:Glycosyl hydrolase family 1 [Bradyrhizobium sp. cf659]|nr:Glycosyl hydrolase family 1 [Bradyrhizobium sp. cf659]